MKLKKVQLSTDGVTKGKDSDQHVDAIGEKKMCLNCEV